MKFLIISHTPHLEEKGSLAAYAPYVKEMNLWLKHVDAVEILAPTAKNGLGLALDYNRKDITFTSIPAISLASFFQTIRAVLLLPYLFLKIFKAMQRADHIHLRCPGNIGLLGCIAQVFFPKKKKTAKYAGNWDPKAKQPWSYRLQKAILRNEKLSKNMKVLVYGTWPEQTDNVQAFFTATYTEADKTEVSQRKYDLPLRFLFVGNLSAGKQPVYALKLVNELIKNEIPSELHIYGEGMLTEKIKSKIKTLNLEKFVYLNGNQSREQVDLAYTKSHFLILPSKSEGWPKVVAEAMWWGVIPITSQVSCLPWMLAEGSRGILLQIKLKKDVQRLKAEFSNKNALRTKAYKAMLWSRKYSLERFEIEIKKLL